MENGKEIRRETGKETVMENGDKSRLSNLSQLMWCLGSFVAQAEVFFKKSAVFSSLASLAQVPVREGDPKFHMLNPC